jgi:hypothetical protein
VASLVLGGASLVFIPTPLAIASATLAISDCSSASSG